MTDTIKYYAQCMKEINDINPSLVDDFQKVNNMIQKYTGTLANHPRTEELLIARYDYAKMLVMYKNTIEVTR